MSAILPFREFGHVASDVVASIGRRMKSHRRNYATGEAIELTDEFLVGSTPFVRALDAAGFSARDRGATISLIRHGLLVSKGGKSEIVRLEQVEGGVLELALNRVAPYAWELEG